MALVITTYNSFSGSTKCQWYIGQKYPNIKGLQIIELQADGDELEYILHNFENIPYSNARVLTWYNDLAMFIANNMP